MTLPLTTRTERPLERRFAGLAGDLVGRDDARAPLVFLPGLTFDRTIWRPVLAELARVDPDRRVLTLDLPGHGESPDLPPHTVEATVGRLRRAVDGAELEAPVMVGHSISGGIVSLYAGRYPTRGVINIDAPPDLAPMARLLQSVAGQVRGSGFSTVWQMMVDSFRLDLLPPDAQQLVRATSRPRPELVRSYWRQLLDTPPEQLQAEVVEEMRRVDDSGVPYLLILGAAPPTDVRSRIAAALRHATVEVWPGSGHFPHLAHPRRFAARLRESGRPAA